MDLADRNDNEKMIFSQDTYEKISRIVYELRTRLKAELCVFADTSGYPIEHNGSQSEFNVQELTAVAAGSFATSNEMSKMISDEPSFDHVFYEGASLNGYMCSVASEYLMFIIFRKTIPIGLVRLLTHHAVDRLTRYLQSLQEETQQVTDFLNDDFRRSLNDELDKALG